MSTPGTARAYKVHAGNPQEDCILAFAPTAREAKRAGWPILNHRGAEWLDMRAEWIRTGADVHRITHWEGDDARPYAVEPVGCIDCMCWSPAELIRYPDLCSDCQEDWDWENDPVSVHRLSEYDRREE